MSFEVRTNLDQIIGSPHESREWRKGKYFIGRGRHRRVVMRCKTMCVPGRFGNQFDLSEITDSALEYWQGKHFGKLIPARKERLDLLMKFDISLYVSPVIAGCRGKPGDANRGDVFLGLTHAKRNRTEWFAGFYGTLHCLPGLQATQAALRELHGRCNSMARALISASMS